MSVRDLVLPKWRVNGVFIVLTLFQLTSILHTVGQ